jgi:hypothetical protein
MRGDDRGGRAAELAFPEKNANRFSDKDMRKIKKPRAHPDST